MEIIPTVNDNANVHDKADAKTNERNWCMSLQCIFIYNHHKDTSMTLKASADITFNNEQHVRISLFDASSWPIATGNGQL
jgi:hypothetical protein